MNTKHLIKGLHHVTATVNDAQEDYHFYTQLLGLRLVKKTVNFENNQVYHFYYGNELGEPGTIMTTFPYKGQNVRQGVKGTGQVAITAFSIDVSALAFWKTRLTEHQVPFQETLKFGNTSLLFEDPSGLEIELVANTEDVRSPWESATIPAEMAIQGIFNATLSIAAPHPTFEFLIHEFGLQQIAQEGNITRFAALNGEPGQYVDIRHDANLDRGKNGIGTVHHLAWRVENDEALVTLRNRIANELGLNVTEVKDRKYFHSIYFRMPGKVLFEIATIPPGFAVDESVENLGQKLQLPDWEEVNRAQIESVLPEISHP